MTVHQGQTTIIKGPIAEVNSASMDLVAFNVKAKILVALHHVLEAESALCNMKCPFHELAKSLSKARQSFKEWWQDKHKCWHMPELGP